MRLGLCLALALAVGCGGKSRGGSSGGAGSSTGGQGGSGGAGGQGGTIECAPGSDYDATSCFNGVVTYQVFCPPTFQTVGVCPNGCRQSGAFGNVGLTLCNPEPSDGGGAGQGGAPGCGPTGNVGDNIVTQCSDGVVTVTSGCPPGTARVGTCAYGCKYPGAFGYAGLSVCNTEPPDAGCDGPCDDASDAPIDVSDGN